MVGHGLAPTGALVLMFFSTVHFPPPTCGTVSQMLLWFQGLDFRRRRWDEGELNAENRTLTFLLFRREAPKTEDRSAENRRNGQLEQSHRTATYAAVHFAAVHATAFYDSGYS